MRIYIASPYTLGDTAENVRQQIFAAERLIEKGHTPFVPLLTHFWHFLSPHSHAYWMKQDFDWLESCDAILRLSGKSVGADLEVSRAKELNLFVFNSLNEVPNNEESTTPKTTIQ